MIIRIEIYFIFSSIPNFTRINFIWLKVKRKAHVKKRKKNVWFLEFSERMHREAAEYMMTKHDDHFTYFSYDKEKVHQRLDEIFARLFKEKYLDCSSCFVIRSNQFRFCFLSSGCDAGQLITDDSQYWWAKTKVHLTTYLIQRQPFHLTDGAWLRGVQQGPMSSIQSKLFSIYIDELGNGDVEQNHCNVYLDVLESLGLKIPPITSREFVDQQSILEISFKKPLLTLTTSLFPKTFEPEILGYTLVKTFRKLFL